MSLNTENLTWLATLVRETFRLDRDLVIFDLETTEPNPDTARVVEFGFVNVKIDGTQSVYRTLVNPGMPIPHEATYGRPGTAYEGHGITDAMVKGCRICGMGAEDTDAHVMLGDTPHTFAPWPTFATLARSIVSGFNHVDFAGTNIRFDLKVIRNEARRSGIEWDYDSASVVDVYRIEQIGEPRTLSDIYEKYFSRKFAGSHGALADVAASIEVLNAQLKRFSHLPRTVSEIHQLIWQGWIDTDGKFVFNGTVPTGNFGKVKGIPMKDIDRGFYDWMLKPKQQFAPSTRRIVANALKGIYPVAPEIPDGV